MPTLESNSWRAGLVCVGSELLRGKVNTHASALARRLSSLGLPLVEEHTVPDNLAALTRVIRETVQRNAVTFVTGGLGPTFDDITREASADAVGHPLVRSSALLRGLSKKFRRVRYKMPPANARQADVLRGATALENTRGTAPGQWLLLEKSPTPRLLILLPGPPSELHPMLEQEVMPRLKRLAPKLARAEAHLHFVGVPESVVDHHIRPIIAKAEKALGGGVDFTILANLGLVDFDVFVKAAFASRAQAALDRIVDEIRRKLGNSFYGANDAYPLEKVVLNHFVKNRWTLAVAESCTGGMLAERLTEVSGSSAYFLGGVVSYHNSVKEQALGVDPKILKTHGAVSEPVARAMAKGVRTRFGASWGLSITGVAGPIGGSIEKPVGTVFVGVASAQRSEVFQFDWKGQRDAIRMRSVIAALDLLRRC